MWSILLSVVALSALGDAAPGQTIKRQANITDTGIAQSCPAGFKNVVFNTIAPCQPDWPNRFSTLQKVGGIENLIGFYVDPMPGADAHIAAAQVRQIMDPRQVQKGIEMMTLAEGAPEYMVVFNEPDFSFMGFTPLTSAADAAVAVQPLLTIETNTKMLAPAIAITESEYLEQFFAACNCTDKFPIIPGHVYAKDPARAKYLIETIHKKFPDKEIWLTEFGPLAGPEEGCELDEQGVIDWMNEMVTFAANTGYVKKIFWNAGEYGFNFADEPERCNPSLTDESGAPTNLLRAYGQLCSGGAAATEPQPAPAAAAAVPAASSSSPLPAVSVAPEPVPEPAVPAAAPVEPASPPPPAVPAVSQEPAAVPAVAAAAAVSPTPSIPARFSIKFNLPTKSSLGGAAPPLATALGLARRAAAESAPAPPNGVFGGTLANVIDLNAFCHPPGSQTSKMKNKKRAAGVGGGGYHYDARRDLYRLPRAIGGPLV
ncbi:MAG: hypothetical protein M1825_002095 [Sarcosagium campestre]|nr:MAG: hypothetical protein M1825_002095 [Sarcosagium campestre]